jgi:hypothetical protein
VSHFGHFELVEARGGLKEVSHFPLGHPWPVKRFAGVYFALLPAGEGFLKIGSTRHVAQRLSELQTACPVDLRLLAVLPGGMTRERIYRARFRHLQTRGEWLRWSPEIAEWLDDYEQAQADLFRSPWPWDAPKQKRPTRAQELAWEEQL